MGNIEKNAINQFFRHQVKAFFSVQLYTICAVLKPICAVLNVNLCSSNYVMKWDRHIRIDISFHFKQVFT